MLRRPEPHPYRRVVVAYPTWLQVHGNDVWLDIFISVSTARNRTMGIQKNRLHIQLCHTPADALANAALSSFLASTLGLARAQISIISGWSKQRKTVRLLHVPVQRVLLRLSPKRPF